MRRFAFSIIQGSVNYAMFCAMCFDYAMFYLVLCEVLPSIVQGSGRLYDFLCDFAMFYLPPCEVLLGIMQGSGQLCDVLRDVFFNYATF